MSGLATRRSRQIAIQTIAAVVVAVVLWLLVFGDPRLGRYSHNNFDRITDGSTLSEVEALLGAHGEPFIPYTEDAAAPPRRYFEWKEPGGASCIVVEFDADGRVRGKRMFEPIL